MKKKMVGKSAIVVVTMSTLALASYPAFAAEQNTRTAAMTIWNDVEEITEDELTYMFDRFYTGKNGNTGIGLALAKEIIELHDWNISVERRESGVAFLVRW